MKNIQATLHSGRKGVIVVLFALLIPVLIVILGFTIDYANIQRVRNEARMVADLSAKAAADTLARTGGKQGDAITAAKDVALANTIAGEVHHLQTSDIIFGRATQQTDGSYSFGSGATPFNSVRVNARRTDTSPDGRIPQFFGMFYGQPDFDLIQTATASFRDVEVCLVLDRSGSMKWKTNGITSDSEKDTRRCIKPKGDSRWISLDKAIEEFIKELDATPVQEKVAMVTFASDGSTACIGPASVASTLDQVLTSNLNLIKDSMNSYKDGVWFGGTNITAGLATARAHMESIANPNVDRVIIVFTDGQHNTSTMPFGEATACAASGIAVHTITFSDDANTTDMVTVAANGGGEHYHAVDTEGLKTIFKRLAGSFAILTE